MLLIDGGLSNLNMTPYPSEQTEVSGQDALTGMLSNVFVLRITGEDIESYEQPDLVITENTVCNITVNRTVTDIDGNVYRTVKIGNQWWMAENLKVTRYRNGEAIPEVIDNSAWAGLTTGACCNYNNDPSNTTIYGLLYNWYAVNDLRGLAPEGWHVPADAEWKELEMAPGMSQLSADSTGYRGTDEGGKLKEAGTTHWGSPNTGATDESGFTALPGGARYYETANFTSMGLKAFFWSSTGNPGSAVRRSLDWDNSKVYRFDLPLKLGFSVRCVRD